MTGLEPPQKVGDCSKKGVDLSDFELERKIEDYRVGKEDLPANTEAEFDMSSEIEILNQADLDRIRRTYGIPETSHTRLLREGEDLAWPPTGEVAVSDRFFKCRLNIPLSLYFQELISGLNVASGRLNPNAWRTLTGCYVLWKEAG